MATTTKSGGTSTHGVDWNPWHGCHKYSAGCLNCYVYRMDGRHQRDASVVQKTSAFYLPISHARDGSYKIPSGSLIGTCFTSDFLLEDADTWRGEAWRMIRERSDCHFLFITKRITRFDDCIPEDWGEGYRNLTICCTVENQAKVDERLPVFRDAKIAHKIIVCEPLLERWIFRRIGRLGGQCLRWRRVGDRREPVIMIGFWTFASSVWQQTFRSVFGRRAPIL